MTHSRRAALGAIIGSALMLAFGTTAHADDKKITLGFAQVGAESAWRTANTVSVKAAAKDAGINLKFSDAQQKQENQIKAIRSYIAQKVDVIAFSPVVESGWEPVLIEAKNAKIPVILTDRNIDVKDTSLYVTMIGSDFLEEGRRGGKWLEEHYKNEPGPINIAELQGTVGSAPANDRHAGLLEVIKNDPKFKMIASQSGDFTLAGGKQVMEAFIKTYGKKINVVYAHNDDMALGAIQAMEEAGMQAGQGRHRRLVRCNQGRLPGDGRGQDQRRRGMQPAARAATDDRGEGRGGRQAVAQAHRDGRNRVPDERRRAGAAAAQVLKPSDAANAGKRCAAPTYALCTGLAARRLSIPLPRPLRS